MTTKTGQVLRHLENQGKITSWEAIQLYRATRLSAIIYNLRHKGYDIASIWVENDSERYVIYTMKVGANNVKNN